MNKKGMALSTILYTLLVLFLSLLFGILGLVNSARITLNKLKKEVINNLNGIGPTEAYNVYNAGDIIYYNPIDNIKCSAEDEVADRIEVENGITSGNCKKWYVIEKNDSEKKPTIDVILNHNVSSYVYWTPEGSSYLESSLKIEVDKLIIPTSSGGNGWNTSLNPRLITADEIAMIIGASSNDTIKWDSEKEFVTTVDDIDIDSQISWFYLDGGLNQSITSYSSNDGWQKQVADSNTKSKYYWLFDNLDDCLAYGCEESEIGDFDYGDMGDKYWTSTSFQNDDIAFAVYYEGNLLDTLTGEYMDIGGIRPVVTISKKIIK